MRTSIVLTIVIGAFLAACTGADERSTDEMRTVAVSMSDSMRYDPGEFEFSVGETVRFEVTNAGSVPHELFIGDAAGQEEHAAEMAGMEGEMAHEEPGLVGVEPGATETLEYTFDEAGQLLGACHEPGHYEAGMVAAITVQPES